MARQLLIRPRRAVTRRDGRAARCSLHPAPATVTGRSWRCGTSARPQSLAVGAVQLGHLARIATTPTAAHIGTEAGSPAQVATVTSTEIKLTSTRPRPATSAADVDRLRILEDVNTSRVGDPVMPAQAAGERLTHIPSVADVLRSGHEQGADNPSTSRRALTSSKVIWGPRFPPAVLRCLRVRWRRCCS